MESFTTSTPRHFTVFRSVREEAATKMQHDEWESEGGHILSTTGRVVRTPGAQLPYKVVLRHRGRPDTEQAFSTMRASEAFIRKNIRVPLRRSSLRDRGPCAL